MNLSEEKKEPLRLQLNFRKKEMLAMHMKSTVQVAIFFLIWHYFPKTSIIDIPIFVLNIPAETSESIRYTPQDYIVYLGNPGLSIHRFTHAWSPWESPWQTIRSPGSTTFVCEGLNQVLTIPNECHRRCVSIQRHTRSLWKCQMFNSWYDYTGTRDGTRSNTSASAA